MSRNALGGGLACVVSPAVVWNAAHPIARVSDVLQRVRVSAGELQPQFAARLQVLPVTVELAEAGRLPTREAAVRYATRVLERCSHALTLQARAVLGAYVGGAK